MPAARLDTDGSGVVRLTLARPESGNALDAAIVEDMLDAVAKLGASPPRALVLAGDGNGFCGGFDLDGLASQSDGDLALRFIRIELLLQAIHHFPAPTVALAHRFAWGAGADLFAACRIRVADPDTRFSFPGARFGIVLGSGRLARCVGGQQAFETISAGRPVAAAEALAMGLATHIVPKDRWDSEAIDALVGPWAGLASETMSALLSRLTPDDRAADLAALASSAARPGLGERIAEYAAAQQSARRKVKDSR